MVFVGDVVVVSFDGLDASDEDFSDFTEAVKSTGNLVFGSFIVSVFFSRTGIGAALDVDAIP